MNLHRLLWLVGFTVKLSALDYAVTTNATIGPGSLRDAIDQLNLSPGPHTITFSDGIGPLLLSEDLPIIKEDLTISSPVLQEINGRGMHRLFVAEKNLTLINITVTAGVARGGDSYNTVPGSTADTGGGGGGGLGAGGGSYVAPSTTLTLTNASYTANTAQGGRGGNAYYSEGNHDGRSGGGASFTSPNQDASQAQGGGSTAGGQQGYNGSPQGAGGTPGGGAGASNVPGQAGSPGSGSGGAGSGGGKGGDGITSDTTLLSGGIGGAGGGGGGAGGSAFGGNSSAGPGGPGGAGGGGGGGSGGDNVYEGGGGGGFGGGGGGGSSYSLAHESSGGGGGGFGGGGGGGAVASAGGSQRSGAGGGGGFGGGGAGSGGWATNPSTYSPAVRGGGKGGRYGGDGGYQFSATNVSGAGGGGAAIGGAIFAGLNSIIQINGTITISGNTLTAGVAGTNLAGATAATNGQAIGQDIFLYSGAQIQFLSGTSTVNFGITADSTTPDGGISVSGAGTNVTFTSTSLTYSGPTTITNGTLNLSGNSSIASSSGVTVTTPGVFDITAITSSTQIQDFSGSGPVHLGAKTLIAGTTNNTTYSGIMDGAGGNFTKVNGGTLSFSGANSYSGATTISAGTLALTANGSITSSSTVNISSGAFFDISAITPAGTSILNLAGAGTLNLGGKALTINSTSSSSFSGMINGPGGSLNKSGTGDLSLFGVNNYTGGTTFTNGTLKIVQDGTLGIGNLTFSGGTLETDGTTTTTKPVTLTAATTSTIRTASGTSFTINNIIGGNGNLVKEGSGTLNLQGNNAYSGTTTINNGTLTLTAAGSLASSSAISINNSATLDLSGITPASATILQLSGSSGTNLILGTKTLTVGTGASTTFAGVISSGVGGHLSKTGAGTLTLSGTNTYSGGTTFNAGAIQISSDANLGTGNLTFSGGTLQVSGNGSSTKTSTITTTGTIQVDPTFSFTLSGPIGGPGGSLTKTGTGTLILTGSNTYGGGTTVSDGVLQGNATSLQGNITNNASIVFDQTGTGTYAGILSGTGTLTKQNTGTLTLTQTNPYNGNTLLNGGTLVIANHLKIGTGTLIFNGGILETTGMDTQTQAVTINTTGTYNVDPGITWTVSSAITGAGSLIKTNSGTLILTNNTNSYMGGTTINGGVVQISDDGDLGAPTGSITLNGGSLETSMSMSPNRTLTLLTGGGSLITTGAANTLSLTQPIDGVGALTKLGSGTLVLSGLNSYSGGTNVNAGTISISNNVHLGTGSLTFSGGNLQTTATITTNRLVQINAPAIFDITAGPLTLLNTISGAGSLEKTGSGTLVLLAANAPSYSGAITITNGALQISSDANLSSGASIILNGGALKTTATFTTGKSVNLTATGTFDVDTSTILSIPGLISGTGPLIKIGGGTLNLSGGGVNLYTMGTSITGGLIKISSDSNLGSGGISLNGGGLEISGSISSTKTFTFAGAGTINVDSGQTFTLMAPGTFTGGGSLVKTGGGTLDLTASAPNSYMGGTFLDAGILKISSNANLGVPGSITFNGGTLETTANIVPFSQPVILNTSGTFNVNPGTTLELSQMISGTETLIKTNSGTLKLSNATNNYMGGTVVNGGILQVSQNANLGDPAGSLVLNQGTLEVLSSFPSARNITLAFSQGGVFKVNAGQTLALNAPGVIGGGGILTKSDSGTLILSGMNAYTGGTVLNDGTLSVSQDFNLGTGDLTLNGGVFQVTASFQSMKTSTLNGAVQIETVNAGTNLTLFDAITGAGSLEKIGAGTLILLGFNTYLGGTIVTAGALQGDGRGLQGNILNNASVIFDLTAIQSFSGAISGSGSLTKQNTGTIILSNTVNMYSGGTFFEAGSIGASDDTNLGTMDLTFNGGSLLVLGSFTSGKNVHITTSATINVLGSLSLTMSGIIDGAVGSLIKTGAGTLFLSNTNSYGAGTSLNAGTLSIMASGALGTGGLTFNSGILQATNSFSLSLPALLNAGGGSFNVPNAADTFAYSGAISGIGSLTKTGAGTLSLPSPNSYMGGTFFNQGIINVAADNSLGDSSGALTFNGGTFLTGGTFSSARDITINTTGTFEITGGMLTLANPITGLGILIKNGPGTLLLNGNNNYSGGTVINGGTLQGVSQSLQGSILNNGTLIFDQTSAGIFNGSISGTGSVVVNGPGPLYFTLANSHSGGTHITSGGDLQGNTSSIQGDFLIDAGGFLTFQNNLFSGTYSGSLTGAGTVSIDIAAGRVVTFSGNSSSFTGETQVNSGTLSVIGNLGGVCEVSVGGILRGSGTVGTLNNSGSVYPGASIATLTVMGNYTSSPTSTLEIEISGLLSDALNVTGTTLLAGALSVVIDPGDYSNQTFTIINSVGNISGGFSSVTISPASFTYTVLTNLHTVQLVISGGFSPPLFSGEIPGNAGQIAAQFLCPAFPFGSNELLQIAQSLATLPAAQFIEALNKMGPAQLGALPILELENNSLIGMLTFEPLLNQFFSTCSKESSLRIIPIGFKFSRTNVSPDLPQFDNSSYGVSFLGDYEFSNEVTFGANISYLNSQLHWSKHQGHAKNNSFFLAPYATYASEKSYLGLTLQGSADFNEIHRKIVFPGVHETAKSTPVTWNFLAKAVFGYRLFKTERNVSNHFSLQPEVILDSLCSWEPSFSEHGAGILDLNLKEKFSSYFRSLVNLRMLLAKTFKTVCLEAGFNAGWMRTIPITNTHYTAGFKNFTACEPTFTVQSYERTLDQLVIGANVSVTENCIGLTANYQGNFGSATILHELDFGFFYRF